VRVCFLIIMAMFLAGAQGVNAEGYLDALNRSAQTQSQQQTQRAKQELAQRAAQAQSPAQSQAQKQAMQQYFLQLQNNPPSGAATSQNRINGESRYSAEYLNSRQGVSEIKQYWDGLSHSGRVQYCDDVRQGCFKEKIESICRFFYENCQRKY
jgi:hypothetical protein